MEEDPVDKVVQTAIAGVVGVIIICSLAIPIVAQMITMITTKNSDGSWLYGSDVPLWSTMISLVVLMMIVGLIIAIVRAYSLKRAR